MLWSKCNRNSPVSSEQIYILLNDILLNIVRKKFEIFWGINFFCMKINLLHKLSHRVTADLGDVSLITLYTL